MNSEITHYQSKETKFALCGRFGLVTYSEDILKVTCGSCRKSYNKYIYKKENDLIESKKKPQYLPVFELEFEFENDNIVYLIAAETIPAALKFVKIDDPNTKDVRCIRKFQMNNLFYRGEYPFFINKYTNY